MLNVCTCLAILVGLVDFDVTSFLEKKTHLASAKYYYNNIHELNDRLLIRMDSREPTNILYVAVKFSPEESDQVEGKTNIRHTSIVFPNIRTINLSYFSRVSSVIT